MELVPEFKRREVRFEETCQRRALLHSAYGENTPFRAVAGRSMVEDMSTETLLIIVVLVLLFGGGGFFYSRRGRK